MGLDFRRPKHHFGFRWGEALIWAVTGEKGISTLISGTPPLTLGNALKAALVSLVQHGKVEQDDTPTPSAPVNIKCNNGVLKYGSGGIYVDGNDEVITLSSSGAEDQTASAANLFAAGNCEDTQDIISGAVTRNVGIKVLDGTESWTRIEANCYTTPVSDANANTANEIICTHFLYNASATLTDCCRLTDTDQLFICMTELGSEATANDFKSWLAGQYAAGTPVIVLYPLATPATETVTSQPLSTEEGDNTMTVTAEVDNIEFDVTYMAQN